MLKFCLVFEDMNGCWDDVGSFIFFLLFLFDFLDLFNLLFDFLIEVFCDIFKVNDVDKVVNFFDL